MLSKPELAAKPSCSFHDRLEPSSISKMQEKHQLQCNEGLCPEQSVG